MASKVRSTLTVPLARHLCQKEPKLRLDATQRRLVLDLLDRVFGAFEPTESDHYLVSASVGPVTVDEFRIATAETFDVIVEPSGQEAFTIFAPCAASGSALARVRL